MLFQRLPSRGTQQQLGGGLGELARSNPKHTLTQSEMPDFGESCEGHVAVTPKSRVFGPGENDRRAPNQSRAPVQSFGRAALPIPPPSRPRRIPLPRPGVTELTTEQEASRKAGDGR